MRDGLAIALPLATNFSAERAGRTQGTTRAHGLWKGRGRSDERSQCTSCVDRALFRSRLLLVRAPQAALNRFAPGAHRAWAQAHAPKGWRWVKVPARELLARATLVAVRARSGRGLVAEARAARQARQQRHVFSKSYSCCAHRATRQVHKGGQTARTE